MEEGTRITQNDETSKISLTIGIGVALLAIGGVVYFTMFAHSVTKQMTGFDPKRPVPDDATLKKRLSADSYRIVRENGTETAFKNKLWDKFIPGIYVDVITGEPLFSSVDKFDGGTGRPTFGKPISTDSIATRDDNSYDMHRTEVHSKLGNAHLGHLIQDPTSPTGQRYAVNSAALRFIPTEEMEHEGYASYMSAVSPATQK